jgi:hypothetical protein
MSERCLRRFMIGYILGLVAGLLILLVGGL